MLKITTIAILCALSFGRVYCQGETMVAVKGKMETVGKPQTGGTNEAKRKFVIGLLNVLKQQKYIDLLEAASVRGLAINVWNLKTKKIEVARKFLLSSSFEVVDGRKLPEVEYTEKNPTSSVEYRYIDFTTPGYIEKLIAIASTPSFLGYYDAVAAVVIQLLEKISSSEIDNDEALKTLLS